MEKGQIISGVAHAGVILWVVLGDWLFRADTLPEMEVAEVSLMSAAEFDAMMASAPQPVEEAEEQPAAEEPVVTPPEPVQPEETPPPAEEVPPPQPEEPLPEELPEEAVPQPIETPDPVAPIADVEQPIPVAPSDVKPRPRPVDRVAAVPVESEDAPEVADQVVEQVADEPTEEAVIVEEEQEAAAPEEATTQIVTEAVETEEDAPQLAMTSSLRPRSRPAEPAPEEVAEEEEAVAEAEAPAEEPVEDAATEDAVAAALAEALAEESVEEPAAATSETAAQSDLPVGPPMTAGEKDALRVAVQSCWNLGALSMEALRTTVTVGFSVAQNGVPDAGSITMVESNGDSDTATRQAYEAARRAIIRCGANGFPLPPEKYDQWKNIEIVFDPNGMRMR